jgi:uncharacterized protein (DUF1697 family)
VSAGGDVRWIALLRGINVGKAKRIAMADLRCWLEELGFTGVRTLRNSGNAVFDADPSRVDAAALEDAIAARAGFRARVVVVGQSEWVEAVRDNPLEVPDPSRFVVGWVTDPAAVERVRPLLDRPWSPDALAVRGRAVYQRCAAGLLDSPMAAAVARALGDEVTARNWSTTLELRDLLERG